MANIRVRTLYKCHFPRLTPLEYARHYNRVILPERYRFQILEAICNYDGLFVDDIKEAVGCNRIAASYGLQLLRREGLITKPGGSIKSHCPWRATEKGKIALAIHLGKMARKAVLTKSEAA